MENIIGQRINTALAKRNIRQKELAKQIGVKDNVVSYWCSGTRIPNTMQIVQIAEILNVSADYLLGLSDVATDNTELKAVCEYTGLNELSVVSLNHIQVIWNHYEKVFDFVNSVIKYLDDNQTLVAEYCYYYNEVKNLIPYVYGNKQDKINIDLIKSLGVSLNDENKSQDFYNILMTKFDESFNKLMICRYRLSTLFDNLFYDEQIDELERVNVDYYAFKSFCLKNKLSNLEKGSNKNEQE